jgi:hypothetical protein
MAQTRPKPRSGGLIDDKSNPTLTRATQMQRDPVPGAGAGHDRRLSAEHDTMDAETLKGVQRPGFF